MKAARPIHEWQDNAACKGKTALFFPEPGKNENRTARAKKICRTCPVYEDCLAHVTYNIERFGIWAGMNVKERSKHRAKLGIKLSSVPNGYRTKWESGCRCHICVTEYGE